MHQYLYCEKLLYAPLRFCSTEHAALYHRIKDPVAWAAYQARYPERLAARRAMRNTRTTP